MEKVFRSVHILSVHSLRFSLPILLGSCVLWWLLLKVTASHHDAGGVPILLTFFSLFLAPLTVLSGSWLLLSVLYCTKAVFRQWHLLALLDKTLWLFSALLSFLFLIGFVFL